MLLFAIMNRPEENVLNISGIVIGARPELLDGVVERLEQLPGVSVFQVDVQSARIVVTQDVGSDEEQEAGLRRIQALPGVAYSELVYHYFGGEDQQAEDSTNVGGARK